MTAPNPTPKAQPRKASPTNKQTPAKVTPIDATKKAVADKAAANQPAKAPVKNAPAAPTRELSKVGPLPKPAKLDWTEKDGVHLAASGRWRYRVSEGGKGWYAEQATGSWTPLHGDPQTVEQAKHIAEIVDAGAHWVGWAKYRTLSWAEIEKAAKEAGE